MKRWFLVTSQGLLPPSLSHGPIGELVQTILFQEETPSKRYKRVGGCGWEQPVGGVSGGFQHQSFFTQRLVVTVDTGRLAELDFSSTSLSLEPGWPQGP